MGVCRVIGIESVLEQMKAKGEKIAGPSLDKALKTFSQDLRLKVQAAAPTRVEPKFRKYGPIRKSVFVKKIEAGLSQAISEITYRVGITNKAFYAWFIEHGYSVGGTRERSRAGGKSVTKHTGSGVRHVAARPFFRPVVDSAEPEFSDAILNDLRQDNPELQ